MKLKTINYYSVLFVLLNILNATNTLCLKEQIKHENIQICKLCQKMLTVVYPSLKEWFLKERETNITMHIMEAYRDEKNQNRALKSGASKVGWGYSAHNYIPCLAIDVFFLVNGKSHSPAGKYKTLINRLPTSLENGSIFPGLVDWSHFQLKNWQSFATNYPNGNRLETHDGNTL